MAKHGKRKTNWKPIILWTLDIFCILAGLAYMPSVAAFLFLAIGIAGMPIEPIREFWEGLPLYKVLKPTILTILFFISASIAPVPESVPEPETAVESVVVDENEEDITTNVASSEADNATQEDAATVPQEPDGSTTSAQEDADGEDDAGTDAVNESDAPTDENTNEGEDVAALQASDILSIMPAFSFSSIPTYSDSAYVAVNDNIPFFANEDIAAVSCEYYSPLDNLGRCGICYAVVGKDIMPTEERGEIGSVKPTGWNQNKYAGLVEGNYLYNRCHLIGFQLTGENANTSNLITGTRYLNIEGMLPFENMIADYVKETGNHVAYRAIPIFDGNNLLSSGVLLEAKSLEDGGAGVQFNVFSYNVQPGVTISYTDGSNYLAESASEKVEESTDTDNGDGNSQEDGSEPEEEPEPEPKPEPEPEPEPETPSGGSGDAWLSETGSKYHSRNDCGRMNPNKARKTTVSDAEAQGYKRCSKCW